MSLLLSSCAIGTVISIRVKFIFIFPTKYISRLPLWRDEKPSGQMWNRAITVHVNLILKTSCLGKKNRRNIEKGSHVNTDGWAGSVVD